MMSYGSINFGSSRMKWNQNFTYSRYSKQIWELRWVMGDIFSAQELGMNLHFSVRDAPCEKSRMLRPKMAALVPALPSGPRNLASL